MDAIRTTTYMPPLPGPSLAWIVEVAVLVGAGLTTNLLSYL